VNNATSGYEFSPLDRGSLFILTGTSNSAPFGISQGFLGVEDVGYYVNLKNGSSGFTFPIFYNDTPMPSTGNGILSNTAILYWSGSSYMLYL
jgi:hypothetical protein